MFVPLQICNGTDTNSIILQHMQYLMGSCFCVWCGICTKYLAFGTYPTSIVGALMSYPISSMENAKGAVLIDESTRQWNEELIDGIFASDEAAIIKKIPLGRLATEDVLIWPYSDDGSYTCKSGYRFLQVEAELPSNQQPSTLDTHLWKQLWSLQVPNKVRNLLWRACRNAMPTKASLVRRT